MSRSSQIDARNKDAAEPILVGATSGAAIAAVGALTVASGGLFIPVAASLVGAAGGVLISKLLWHPHEKMGAGKPAKAKRTAYTHNISGGRFTGAPAAATKASAKKKGARKASRKTP